MKITSLLFTTIILMLSQNLHAQLGSGWVQYFPDKKVHLADPNENLKTFDWGPYVVYGNPPYADYTYDAATETETFKLYENRSNRSEIRLFNDYEFGSRQFEGYVTFYEPLNDESLMQIWASESGATQMMIRGFAANGGEIGINQAYKSGTPKVIKNVYGKEVKVNVIHLQEDVGNKFIVYINNQKVFEFPDNEKPKDDKGNNIGNYHKYGCYGTVVEPYLGPVVKWRAVKHFKDGIEGDNPATSIEQETGASIIPTNYKLLNYPNPFNPSTIINYQLPELSFISLGIYDILGREVSSLVNETKSAGTYNINFDGKELTSGMYIVKLTILPHAGINPVVLSRKIVLAK